MVKKRRFQDLIKFMRDKMGWNCNKMQFFSEKVYVMYVQKIRFVRKKRDFQKHEITELF